MGEFHTVGAIRQSIGLLLRNPIAFLKASLVWSLIDLAILLAYCVYAWRVHGGAFDIAGSFRFLAEPENFRLQSLLTVIPNTLSALAVAILWTRFVVDGRRPPLWLQVPAGSARYFSRSLIVGFGAILAMVPGIVVARLALENDLTASVPQIWKNIGMGTIVVADILVVLYLAIRVWLIFPAIAMGEPLGFRQSFRLTGRAWLPLLVASLVCELAFALPAILVEMALDYLPLSGPLADAGVLAVQLVGDLLTLAGDAAVAGVAALAYRALVPRPA